MSDEAEVLKAKILADVARYYELAFPKKEFIAGKTLVPVSGKVFDEQEIQFLIDSGLDFWLTTGRFAARFERVFADFFCRRSATLVNSGSSANLIALSSLTSPVLGDRRLLPGDEVITVAAGFPTTLNPILQNQLVPVFLDIQVPTYNVEVDQLEAALSDRTRVVMLAHTLGNPFDLAAVEEFARKHDLWLIEDCCDAVGAEYCGRRVGTFGDLATTSFYPAHHITMGEGGSVLTDSAVLKKLLESFRDWGRDCWCDPGNDNTCGKRFDWQIGNLPAGYDHKYVYSHIGYNLKATDMQAAVGLAQMEKLPGFIDARRKNFEGLYQGLKDLEEFFVLPEATPNSEPSWFGFPVAVRPGCGLSRNQVVGFLEQRKIATRLLFGGNLIHQPAYQEIPHRVIGPLDGADFAMKNLFWVGVYPGITAEMRNYVIEIFHQIPALK